MRLRPRVRDSDEAPAWAAPVLYVAYIVLLILAAPWLFLALEKYATWVFKR